VGSSDDDVDACAKAAGRAGTTCRVAAAGRVTAAAGRVAAAGTTASGSGWNGGGGVGVADCRSAAGAVQAAADEAASGRTVGAVNEDADASGRAAVGAADTGVGAVNEDADASGRAAVGAADTVRAAVIVLAGEVLGVTERTLACMTGKRVGLGGSDAITVLAPEVVLVESAERSRVGVT